MGTTDSGSARRSYVVFGLLVIALVAMAGVAFIAFLPHNSVPPAASFTGIDSAASKSASGLSLALSLNSTVVHPGQGVSVTVDEMNTLSEANNVSASSNWPLKGLSIGPCGPLNLPIGIAVFQGYYAAANISTAQPLQLYKPGTYMCPMILSGIGAYVFQPTSDTAAVMGSCAPNPCFTANMSSRVSVGGYWSSNPLQGATFGSFSPGVYTVVGGDEWGGLVVLHFLVTSPNEGMSGGLLLRVVQDDSKQPIAGVTVVAGPASSKDDVAITPGGPTLKECVHGVGNGSTVYANGTVVFSNGTSVAFPACPVKTYTTNSTGWVSIPDAAGLYYFFRVGGLAPASIAYGVVELSQNGETYVTVSMPSGNYTMTP